MSESKIHADVWMGLGVTDWQVRSEFDAQKDQPAKVTSMQTQTSRQSSQPKWVLIGSGLSSIWQQDNHQAWCLWQAILKFHFGSEQAVLFYDTNSLQTEQAMFEVVEQLIELGCEQVFSMDPEHELNEILAEGLLVTPLPSFESMLEQPHLKRLCYERLIDYSA
ncbi:hypothetical protein [Thiomicrospira sp.]|uniref:hypothetical protein n=1 Tax=Thiomicrospira sp. TaxID=935 RepID=UPI002F93E77C